MAEHWKVGDLACCVHKGPWCDGSYVLMGQFPEYGQLLIVTDLCEEKINDQCRQGLRFKEFRDFFDAVCFKKVPPITDEEERKEAALIGAGLETA